MNISLLSENGALLSGNPALYYTGGDDSSYEYGNGNEYCVYLSYLTGYSSKTSACIKYGKGNLINMRPVTSEGKWRSKSPESLLCVSLNTENKAKKAESTFKLLMKEFHVTGAYNDYGVESEEVVRVRNNINVDRVINLMIEICDYVDFHPNQSIKTIANALYEMSGDIK